MAITIGYSDIEQVINKVDSAGTSYNNPQNAGFIPTTVLRGSLLSSTAYLQAKLLKGTTLVTYVALLPISWGASIKDIGWAGGPIAGTAKISLGVLGINRDGSLTPICNSTTANTNFGILISSYEFPATAASGLLTLKDPQFYQQTLREIYTAIANDRSTDDKIKISDAIRPYLEDERCVLGLQIIAVTNTADEASIVFRFSYIESSPGSLMNAPVYTATKPV